MIKNIKKAINWLQSQTKLSPRTDLNRLKGASQKLNLDFTNTKKIHVTGTNGKGSTCSFLTHIIEQEYKVGTFTSPFIMEFNERITINNIVISNHELLKLIKQIYQLNDTYIKQDGYGFSFFELLTLIALLHFSNERVEVIIIEVGIGGLLDSTNIIDYDVSIITNVGLEHTKTLGSTISSILTNKLGIVKTNGYLITNVDKEFIPQVISHCQMNNAVLDYDYRHQVITANLFINVFIYQGDKYQLSLVGDHQIYNAISAIKAVKRLIPTTDYQMIYQGLKSTVWTARLEQVSTHPIIFLDGAHNPHAMKQLTAQFKEIDRKNVFILFSSLGDKDIKTMIKYLQEISDNIYLTSFPDKRIALFGEIITENPDVTYIGDPKTAINHITQQMINPSDTLLITGSLHFAGHIKQTVRFKKTKHASKINH